MGRTAFITGGDKGIGYAIAKTLSVMCENVIVTYNQNLQGAQHLSSECCNICYYQCNLQNKQQVANVANEVLKKFGHIDILVNNAGYENDSTFLKMSTQQWEDVLDVNLISVFYFSQYFAKGMVSNGWGRIINMSSILGYTGVYGGVNYATSKAGVVGFTKSLAKELGAKGVTVNAIAPGVIETDLLMRMPEKYREQLRLSVPSKQFGSVYDIAYIVEFLSTDKAKYINGQTIHVNGGMYAL